MYKRIFLSILLVSQALFNTVLAGDDADVHRQSAFLFAKRQMWQDALLHARATHDDLLIKYFTWRYLKDPQSDAGFESITAFLAENPNWPDKGALEKHAEVALMSGNPSDEVLNEWFKKHPPLTERMKMKSARNTDELNTMIRASWVNDNFDKDTEIKILEKYHSVLRSTDHIRRIDRLLWEDRRDEAKRLLKYVPAGYQKLFQARIALLEDKNSAPSAVAQVPKNLRNNLGLLYARIYWRVKDDNKDGVRELLMSAPAEVPYPEKWWLLRDRQIREAVAEGNIRLAERLLAHNGQKPDSIPYKEAEWLKGWIALEYRNAPEKAYKILSKLMDQVETPAGKSRVAYWLGRATEKIPKTNPARWYGEASRYPTTFYGQLAAWELRKGQKEPLAHSIPSSRQPTPQERENFRKQELVRLVYLLADAKQDEETERFISYITQNAKGTGEMVLATELGKNIGRVDLSVRAAKKVLQHDVVALENGWPVLNTPDNIEIEKPFLLALSRQESEFYSDAVSPSGAIGYMQLLPATAKETAHKAGLSYSSEKLYQPEYNMTIGSIYMNKLVNRFDGSYMLAIAGYNAGPARVRQWVNAFGAPSRDVRGVIDWIEKIPTSETRNYVQHVFENMEVYRFLLAKGEKPKAMIVDDLARGGGAVVQPEDSQPSL